MYVGLKRIVFTCMCICLYFYHNCRIVRGGNNLCDGEVNENNKVLIVKRINDWGFGNKKQVVFLTYSYINLGGLAKF